ncbi:MAG TPA: type I phosphomannose isomerase catalytic subunit [Gammaproteobacteria bacterium]|nr:type I phosphomannose isomerase catalytic subunit [Gammaproteobacteria bacterium]
MTGYGTIAAAVAAGDAALVRRLSAGLLKPLKNNFVERPWGGMRLRTFKRLYPLPDQHSLTGLGLGECFEVSACEEDDEAREHPSRLRFDDGSEIALPALLERHAPSLFGADFAARYGSSFPLLPKILDIKELLSVQGHPSGNTEVYVVIDADPGATLRLGFNRDLDPDAFAAELAEGRACQQALLDGLGPRADGHRLQARLRPWLADREAGAAAAMEALEEFRPFAGGDGVIESLLERLKSLYWRVLDVMNEIPIAAGDVIYNANPPRVAPAPSASAEVHALGDPAGRESLVLEIRRPGPTFRAWDNVRFPMRPVDVRAAVASLNVERTSPEEFRVEPEPVPGRPGAFASVRAPLFALEHLRPAAGRPLLVPAEGPHCLHAIAGRVVLHSEDGRRLGTLDRGESAVVPIGVGAYYVDADDEADAEVVRVSLRDERTRR